MGLDLPQVLLQSLISNSLMIQLYLCEAKESKVKNVKAILLGFEIVFGTEVNFFSSESIGVRAEEPHLSYLADILGYKVGTLLAVFLGLPYVRGSIRKA